MHGCQPKPEYLPRPEEMVQIGAIELKACLAIAVVIDRSERVEVAAMVQIDPTIRREDGTVASEPGGQHAIEHVDSLGHAVPEIFRRADAHQVSRLSLGQLRRHDVQHFRHFRFRFTDAETPDGNARDIRRGSKLSAQLAQLGFHAALANAKEHALAGTIGLGERRDAPLQPPMGAHGCVVNLARLGRESDEMIERHHDVRAELRLDIDCALGRQHVQRTILMRTETHAFFGDFGLLCKREDLESTAVRQNWPLPAHERVEPASRVDELWSWPQHQVICVCEDDLRPESFHLVGVERFDGGLRSDRHEDRRLDRSTARLDGPQSRARTWIGRVKLKRKATSGICGSVRFRRADGLGPVVIEQGNGHQTLAGLIVSRL